MELKGQKACKGVVKGKVFLVHPANESRINDFKEGYILVAYRTTPDFTHVFSKALGIVTEIGGILSHAAIVSREYKIPCVVGVKNLFNSIKDGQEITLDGDNGIITYEPVKNSEPKPPEKPIVICTWCQKIGHEIKDCGDCSYCSACEEYVDGDHECPWCEYCEVPGHNTEDCEVSKYCVDCGKQVDNDHIHDEEGNLVEA